MIGYKIKVPGAVQYAFRHADCVLIVAWANENPAITAFEEKLETVSLRQDISLKIKDFFL